ncbi:ubiquitin activating E1 enzyme [Trypanosoma grayi]|uniref:ubiquitin activating E1 enzyme n=1 Tax=Trypanosoma grayi TaxID=71804 RepID=UPI0004F4495F|nr:ubiquitin activating E1 enzyme [Trypanosoma grayi]KEG15297.1 ubiquitin activating E1 enzyme [Trypanosoma grayi]
MSASTPAEKRLKYKEYAPHIEVSFWYELERRKLHEWRLQEPVVPLTLFNTLNAASSATPANTVSVRRESLGNDAIALSAGMKAITPSATATNAIDVPWSIPTLITGQMQNFNTYEQLHRLSRREALWRVLQDLLLTPLLSRRGSDDEEDHDAADTASEKAWEEMNFALAALFTYVDLKQHRFHYAIAFPVLDLGSPVCVKHLVKGGYKAAAANNGVTYFPSHAAVDCVHAHLLERLRRHPERGPNPFIVASGSTGNVNDANDEVELLFHPFLPRFMKPVEATRLVIAMADVSTMDEFPGWAARNVIGALRLAHPSTTSFVLYCVRHNDVARSVLFDCICDPLDFSLKGAAAAASSEVGGTVKAVGWSERKDAASHVRCIDLGAMMAPERLAESSARLNLNLMKWRMLPELRLDELARCRALVLGSGTLGCNVARHLLMWGVTRITLVDRGKVSFSNPVRQTLFEMSDVINPHDDERNKAIAAANALKRILPTVEAHGVPLTIHMPGHRIDAPREAEAIAEIEKLDKLIQEHDVVFLLTDSREARWLPTVMAAVYDKPVLNAALGFDTYVVMRHGVKPGKGSGARRLGCYFCSDLVAPRDSITARTLDQQCTVTRPGVSAIAAATALELLAQLYNHPLGFACPPYTASEVRNPGQKQDESSASEETSSAECILGTIPHQIRGSVAAHCIYTLHGCQYEMCTACSDPILEAYRTDGAIFVLRCINDPLHIEEVCGVKAFKEKCDLDVCGSWDFDSQSD